jgi:hypothetical protein
LREIFLQVPSAVFDTLHCVANSDYLSLEPVRLAEHRFFSEHVAIVPIKEHAPGTRVCLLRRAGVPLTPVAQELASMAVSFARMLPGTSVTGGFRSMTLDPVAPALLGAV